jgi:hypothetical protein
MRRFAVCLLAGLVFVPLAPASGPSPGVLLGAGGVAGSGLRYVTIAAGQQTRIAVRRGGTLLRAVTVPGSWGIPLVTFGGPAGGLSHDGRTLVLAQATQPTASPLRAVTRFLVLDTRRLGAPRTIRLRGDFAFDALSPQGGTLYLIQHVSRSDVSRYRVRAYDLRRGQLLARVIADKRQAGWVMSGYPIARATSADGRWDYTLYQQQDNYPFVHALDTVTRTAVCIGIPYPWKQDLGRVRVALRDAGRTLEIGIGAPQETRYLLDTTSFRVTKG